MFNVINQFIRCVSIPYALLLLFFLLLPLAKHKRNAYVLCIVVVFMYVWRCFFPITSSRYFASSMVLVIVVFAFFFQNKVHRLNSPFAISILCALTIFNFIHAFSGFRNVYIFDIKDSINNIYSSKKSNYVFIEAKEFKRLSSLPKEGDFTKYFLIPIEKERFDYLLSIFDFWNKNAYYLFSEKKMQKDLKKEYYNGNIVLYKRGNFITNTEKTKCFSIYCEKKFLPKSYKEIMNHEAPLINMIANHGILKTCNLEFDTYVFQIKDKLYWIIGSKLENTTKVIFRIFTSKPDLLPKHRIQYGFENIVFTKNSDYMVLQNDKYTVFEHEIPKEYPITYVISGIEKQNERGVLFYPFHLSKF